ncbi:MAG: hypothetical protein IPK82_34770 [Polyangiaceae bacterium]|nr:hypothetical protein [Polyangiaceae bacterium]
MTARDLWQKVHARFDPLEPASVRALRMDRDESPAAPIMKLLELPFGTPRLLLTGTVGTGKTTELFRVAEEREQKELVVFLRLDKHFETTVGDRAALLSISAWEVCFLAGLAVLRAAENIGYKAPKSIETDLAAAYVAAARAAGAEDDPQVDIARLAKQMAVLVSGAVAGPIGAGLQVLASVAEAGRWSISLGRRPRLLRDSDDAARTVLQSVNTLIGLVQQYARPLLVVLDGLDLIADKLKAKELFVDSQMIANLGCRLVVCGPFALRHSQYAAAVSPQFTQVAPLVNLPVLQHDDPTLRGPGILFFRGLFQRRVRDLGDRCAALLPEALLDELAYYSGGRARSFMQMIQRTAEEGYIADSPATPAIVQRVLRERRLQQETGLHTGHLRVLQSVADDPKHSLPEDSLVDELLASHSLLPYPNESEWYYPNPLLTIHRIKPSVGSTKSH